MEFGFKSRAETTGQPPKHCATQKPAGPGKATPRSPSHILALPNDVAHIIFSKLEFNDKINAGLVCKHWDKLLKAGTGAARHWVIACNFDRFVSKGVVPSRWFVNHAAAIKGVHLSATLSSDGQGAATREVVEGQLPLLADCLPKHGTTLHLKFNYGSPVAPPLLSRSAFQALCPMVKSLHLCDIRGLITPSQFAAICQLSSLEDLYISACDTYSHEDGLQEITSDLSKLENLKGLTLERNGQLKSIPEAISCLQKLEHVNIDGSSIEDMSFSLANLTNLCMKHTYYMSFPRRLQGWRSVVRVAFKDCGLDAIPEALSCLASLTSLDVSWNYFRSGRLEGWPWWPTTLSRVEKLAELDLTACDIFSLPPHISAHVRLTSLEIGQNPLSNLPREMSSLHNLRVLQAQCNMLSTVPVHLLGSLTALSSISIARQFSGNLPPCQDGQNNFLLDEEADFNNYGGSEEEEEGEEDEDSSGGSALSGPSSLTLDLSRNLFGSDPPLREQSLQWPATLSRLRNLGELNLSMNDFRSLPSDIPRLWRLTKLDVRDNYLSSLPEEVTRLQNLRDLVVDGNHFPTIPVSVLSKLTALSSFSLRFQRRRERDETFKISSSLLPILHPGLVKLDLSQEVQWDPRSLGFLRHAMVQVADRAPTVIFTY